MPPQPPGGQGGPCSTFANPTLCHKQSCGQDARKVLFSSKGAYSSGIYGSHKGQRSQGANDTVPSCPQCIWLGCVQPLLKDECVGPFPQLTCVRSASFWPLSNHCCCFFGVLVYLYVCFLVFLCVCLRFDVPLMGKREKAL
jgi:hypothetical protein